MKNTRIRSIVVYLIATFFFVGITYFVYSFINNSQTWALQPINRHLSGDKISGGKILDRNSVILAQTINGKRVYNDDENVRKALLHTVGDGSVLIPTSIQSRFSTELFGYNFVTGFGAPKVANLSKDIKLTLDSSLCATALKSMGDKKGTVIVCNYLTGEVICMISTPTYDVNNRPNLSNESDDKYEGVYINRALSSSFTPGSVFKIITCAAALDYVDDIDKKQFLCKGEEVLDGEHITCLEHHGKLGLEKAMAKSCNIAFADIAIDVGKEKMLKKAEEMGFNKQYTIDGINIAKSQYNVDYASNADLGWSGIGQYNNTVNPMHMMMILEAIANDGEYVKPYIVKSIGEDSLFPSEKHTELKTKRMLSSQTAKKISDIMRYTIKSRYGDSMFPNMQMCAKTGTAEVGEEKLPHGWMVGFSQDKNFPFAFVVITENSGYGIKTAGPIAADVMKKVYKDYK